MQAVVTRDFWDKEDPKETVYHVGDKFSGTAARVNELVDKGFVENATASRSTKAADNG